MSTATLNADPAARPSSTGNAKDAAALTGDALAAGLAAAANVDRRSSRRWTRPAGCSSPGEFFVPELLVAARALKASQALITPLLAGSARSSRGRIVIGTVKGDLHDIGKNLVVALLQGGGFEVIDLGADVAARAFRSRGQGRRRRHGRAVGPAHDDDAADEADDPALGEAGVRGAVKVIVGGAPVTQRFADESGADGYADNAAAAVVLARRLMGRPA